MNTLDLALWLTSIAVGSLAFLYELSVDRMPRSFKFLVLLAGLVILIVVGLASSGNPQWWTLVMALAAGAVVGSLARLWRAKVNKP